MAYEVGAILARLGLDAEAFNKGLNAALQNLNRFTAQANAKFSAIGPSLEKALSGISQAIVPIRNITGEFESLRNSVAAGMASWSSWSKSAKKAYSEVAVGAAALANQTKNGAVLNEITRAAGAIKGRGGMELLPASSLAQVQQWGEGAQTWGKNIQGQVAGWTKWGDAASEAFKKAETGWEAFGNKISTGWARWGQAFTAIPEKIKKIPAGTELGKSLLADLNTDQMKKVESAMASAAKQSEKSLSPVTSALSNVWEKGKQVWTGFKTGFDKASTAIRYTWNTVSLGIRPLTSLFSMARNNPLMTMFGGYLGGVAIKNLIEMANRAEKLSYGFDHLSQKIGAVSSTFLPRLRKATMGTISDMDLMQNANSAILLGASQTEDQFVQLAEGARRLGQAMGIDVNYALQSLSYGIGRQSRLWLDNLGIIVQAGVAQERYAAAIGKTKDQLTDTEKRQAFTIAAMEAMRKAIDELGPDVRLTANAWEQMQATITNTWVAIGQAIINSDFPDAITNFLNDSRSKIVAWVHYIGNIAKGLFKIFSQMDISDALTMMLSLAFRNSLSIIKSLLTRIGPIILQILFDVLSNIVKRITVFLIKDIATLAADIVPGFDLFIGGLENFKKRADSIFEGKSAVEEYAHKITQTVQNEVDSLNKVRYEYPYGIEVKKFEISEWGTYFSKLNDQLRNSLHKVATDPKNTEAVKEVRDLINQIWAGDPKAGETWQRALDRALGGEKIDLIGARSISAFEELAKELGTNFTDELKATLREKGLDASIVDDIFNNAEIQRKLESIDPLAGQSRVVLNKFIQPVAMALGKIIALRDTALKGTQESFVTAIFGDKPSAGQMDVAGWLQDFIKNPVVWVATGQGINYASSALAGFGKVFSGFYNKFFGQRKSFQDILTEVNDAMGELKRKASLSDIPLGLEEYGELVKKLRELDKAIVTAEDSYDSWFMKIIRSVPGVSQAAQLMIEMMKEERDSVKAEVWAAFSKGTAGEFEREIEKANRELAVTDEVMARIKNNEFVDEETIRFTVEWNDKIELTGAEVRRSADQVALLKARVEELGRLKTFDAMKKKIQGFEETLQAQRRELDTWNPLENYEGETGASIRKEMAKVENTQREAQMRQAMAVQQMGWSRGTAGGEEYEQATKDITQTQQELKELNDQYTRAVELNMRQMNRTLAKEIASSIGEGIVDGFLRGEKASKIWVNIATDIFRKQMSRAIDDIGNLLGKALDSALGSLGIGAGLANVALGAVALGVSILGAIKNRQESQVEDFSEAINSSEAMRGVVAGPTNVAIAKMGDSLKFALATTEMLLVRIADGVDRMAGMGNYSSGPGVKNMAVRLSPSSTS